MASAGSIMHYVMAFVLALIAVAAFGVPSATQVKVAGFVKWPGHHETAAQLGIPAGTVKSRTYYALRALRSILEEMGYVR